MIRPGRLKRVLTRVTNLQWNMFVLFTDLGDWNKRVYKDGEIVSLTIVRGGGGGEPVGIIPTTLTAVVKGVATDYKGDFNSQLAVDSFTDAALGNAIGRPTGAFNSRFAGRLLRQTVTDPGPARLRTTEIVFTDWATEAMTIPDNPSYVGSRSTTIYEWIQGILTPMVPTGQVTGHIGYASDLVWVDTSTTNRWFAIGDGIRNLLEDGGYAVVPQRDGSVQLHSLQWLDADAKNWADTFPNGTLPRKFCLTPATITKKASHPGKITYKYREQNNTVWTRNITVGNASRAIHTQDYQTEEWIRIRDTSSDQLYHAMLARANRVADLGYSVPEVTIDLLTLLEYPGDAADLDRARKYVGDLLSMNVFDPIALGYDWPYEARGVYIITQATERIDKDHWTLTLALTRDKEVTGYQTIPLPPNTGRRWRDAYQPWTDVFGPWSDA